MQNNDQDTLRLVFLSRYNRSLFGVTTLTASCARQKPGNHWAEQKIYSAACLSFSCHSWSVSKWNKPVWNDNQKLFSVVYTAMSAAMHSVLWHWMYVLLLRISKWRKSTSSSKPGMENLLCSKLLQISSETNSRPKVEFSFSPQSKGSGFYFFLKEMQTLKKNQFFVFLSLIITMIDLWHFPEGYLC